MYVRLGKEGKIWTARISTGSIGMPDCPAGTRGPPGRRNVFFARADALDQLVDMGFIPCIACKPEQDQEFWNDSVREAITRKYHVAPESFADKTIVPYDNRRLDWERVVAMTGGLPDRIYIPPGLDGIAISQFHRTIKDIAEAYPVYEGAELSRTEIGFYDPSTPDRFSIYCKT
jgi:hypothetical protein